MSIILASSDKHVATHRRSNQILSIVARRLREARTEAGMTQFGVADVTGICRRTIQRYEYGVTIPDVLALEKLSAAYGKPVSWFFDDAREREEADEAVQTATH